MLEGATDIGNALKNRGYDPAHDFGHWKKHESEICAVLNLPVFSTRGLMSLTEKE
jgi:hypothetical protein